MWLDEALSKIDLIENLRGEFSLKLFQRYIRIQFDAVAAVVSAAKSQPNPGTLVVISRFEHSGVALVFFDLDLLTRAAEGIDCFSQKQSAGDRGESVDVKVGVTHKAGKPSNAGEIQPRLKSLGPITVKCGRENYSRLKKIGDLRLILQAAVIIVGIKAQAAQLLLKSDVNLRFAARTNWSERRFPFFACRAEDARAG